MKEQGTHMMPLRPVTILVVEDSPDDTAILMDAVHAARLVNPVHFVVDGEAALDYVRGHGEYTDRHRHPAPGLVFLDINLPKVNGLDVLKKLREDPATRSLPVVMLTVSNSDEDVLRSYELETVVYIQKPVTADNLSSVVQSLQQFQLALVEPAA